jgi:hypothetical protein
MSAAERQRLEAMVPKPTSERQQRFMREGVLEYSKYHLVDADAQAELEPRPPRGRQRHAAARHRGGEPSSSSARPGALGDLWLAAQRARDTDLYTLEVLRDYDDAKRQAELEARMHASVRRHDPAQQLGAGRPGPLQPIDRSRQQQQQQQQQQQHVGPLIPDRHGPHVPLSNDDHNVAPRAPKPQRTPAPPSLPRGSQGSRSDASLPPITRG